MLIRKAVKHDRDKLIYLFMEFENYYQKSLSEEQAGFRSYKLLNEYIRETVDRHLFKPECFVLVAEDDNTLIGYISGEIINKKYRKYNKEGYIDGWFVDKEYQNKGLGRDLLQKSEEEFKKRGCTHIELDTNAEKTNAIQIYEHLGYTKRQVTFFKILKKLWK